MVGPIPLGRSAVLSHLVADVLDAAEDGEDFAAGAAVLGAELACEALAVAEAPVDDQPGVFGEKHMDHLVSEMVSHYHEERPHQAKDNDPLVQILPGDESKRRKRQKKEPPPDVVPVTQIECRERLGGLLKHYSRKAA